MATAIVGYTQTQLYQPNEASVLNSSQSKVPMNPIEAEAWLAIQQIAFLTTESARVVEQKPSVFLPSIQLNKIELSPQNSPDEIVRLRIELSNLKSEMTTLKRKLHEAQTEKREFRCQNACGKIE
jgi:hypothetical protein